VSIPADKLLLLKNTLPDIRDIKPFELISYYDKDIIKSGKHRRKERREKERRTLKKNKHTGDTDNKKMKW
jgi:hypothetical protein